MRNLIRGGVALAALAALSLGPVAAAHAERPTGKGPKHEKGCHDSHHSDTGHGANRSGEYDSTCDGSPSGNGNGGGDAKGRPCAGCVGNADDKNPPGQAPGGDDRDNGYECDGNSGIARTNPAHTGCATPAPAPTTSAQPASKPQPASTKPQSSTKPASTKPTSTKPSSTKPAAPAPEVESSTVTKPLAPASVAGARSRADRPEVLGGALPVTGSGTGTLVALALVFVAAGAALVVCSPPTR